METEKRQQLLRKGTGAEGQNRPAAKYCTPRRYALRGQAHVLALYYLRVV